MRFEANRLAQPRLYVAVVFEVALDSSANLHTIATRRDSKSRVLRAEKTTTASPDDFEVV
jgi:hypothetical protein